MRLSLYEHPDGVETSAGHRVLYDVTADEAHFGAALSERLAPLAGPLIVRCDRIDFPSGGVAYRHTHPGPGIRRLLFGSIRVDADGHVADYGPGDAWFESGPSSVHATASPTEASAFVRVLVLPAAWEGKRTISYVDPADAGMPKLQSAHVYFDRVIAL